MRSIIFIVFILSFIQIKAQNGSVKGKITDASNNTPIAFANILVVGTQIGATSDFDGNFIITGLKSGYVKLQVSFLGYQTQLSPDILIENNRVPYFEMTLEPSDQVLTEVVVKAKPFEKPQESLIAMQRIGIKEIENNPGSNRDISRVIQSFPGVGSTPAFRNDIIIRGGGPSENRFYLDGVEIPVLNHFSTQGASGGPVGIINADFIQSVDFYSGSFPSSKGNALSGVLVFTQKEGSKDKTNLQAAIGASEASLTLDGPIGKNTSYIVSVRRSYLQFLFSAIGLPFLPTFNDYQFKVKTQLNPNNQLTIISLGSLDQLRLNTGIENPDASQKYILAQIPVNNQWSYTFGAVYKNFFESGFHTVVLSRNMLDNRFYKYPDNDESKNKILDYQSQEAENKLRYELSIRKGGIKYLISANLEYADYNNATTQAVYILNALQNLSYQSTLNMIKYGFSGQASKSFFDNRLQATLGLRADGNDYNATMQNPLNQISPRFSASFALSEKIKINGGIGRYFQLPAYTTLGYANGDGQFYNEAESRYIGANHLNFGTEFQPNSQSVISAEAFYKDYFQYPIDTKTGSSLANQGAEYTGVAGASQVVFNGKGRAYGVELLYRINMNTFNFLGTYTYFVSEFTNLNQELLPSSWDSRHIVSLTASKDFKKHWRAGLKWRLVGGLPYTPYDMDLSANVDAWNANGQPYYNTSELNSLRFEPFHQLDLRVDKNFFFDKWSLMVYLDIQNVYNFQNKNRDYVIRAENPDGTYQTTDNGTRYVLERIPNTSGTILPTIGLMIKL